MDINVSLHICDMLYINNCKEIFQKDITLTNTSESICLKCNFLLNIVRVQNNSFTIILQNGFQTYIRNIFENETFQICLPCKNGIHILTICGTINN